MPGVWEWLPFPGIGGEGMAGEGVPGNLIWALVPERGGCPGGLFMSWLEGLGWAVFLCLLLLLLLLGISLSSLQPGTEGLYFGRV